MAKVVPCTKDDTCPLCAAGYPFTKPLVVKDLATGIKYILSDSIAEKIRELVATNKQFKLSKPVLVRKEKDNV